MVYLNLSLNTENLLLNHHVRITFLVTSFKKLLTLRSTLLQYLLGLNTF